MRRQKLALTIEAANLRCETTTRTAFTYAARFVLGAIVILFAVAAPPASAQTWTGLSSGLWFNAGNWSPTAVPISSTSTQLVFEKTSHPAMTNDLPGTTTLDSMTFNLGSNGYTLSGNALKLNTITTNSVPSVTISTAIAVGSVGLTVNGSGDIALNGPISGDPFNALSLTYSGTGTLTLGSSSNTYKGLTTINGGTVALGVGDAIPANTEVIVNAGAQFNIGTFSNTPATAPSDLSVSGGTFRVPSGSGDYYVNDLGMGGGTIDLTGTTNFKLHIIRPNTSIHESILSIGNWIGSGTSSILNDTGVPITINTDSGSQLNAGIILSGAGANPNFIKDGLGALRLSNTGNTANFTIKEGQLQTNDLSTDTGSGAFGTLGPGTIVITNTAFNVGSLSYDGPTATTAKPISLSTVGAIRVAAGGSNLTMTGQIGELFPGSQLTVFGVGGGATPGVLTLSANNTYSGPTVVSGESSRSAVLAIDSIGNAGAGGVNSPLGSSSNAASNLKLYDGAELRITGTNANYSTDRGLTVGITNPPYIGGILNVQNAGTTLTWNGPIANESGAGLIKTGAGTLVLTNPANNYGTTNVEAGQFVLANGYTLPGTLNVHRGGTFAPALGAGVATVGSMNLDLNKASEPSATLAIELGGTTPGSGYDQVHVTGQLSLAGSLAVSLLPGFTPSDGQSFDILDWGSRTGTFESLSLPALSGGLSWDTSNLYAAGVLAIQSPATGGDYNHDGVVNALDYLVWRDSGGSVSDYATWRANFGKTVPPGAGSAVGAAIPEPATFVILLVGAVSLCCGRRRAGA